MMYPPSSSHLWPQSITHPSHLWPQPITHPFTHTLTIPTKLCLHHKMESSIEFYEMKVFCHWGKWNVIRNCKFILFYRLQNINTSMTRPRNIQFHCCSKGLVFLHKMEAIPSLSLCVELNCLQHCSKLKSYWMCLPRWVYNLLWALIGHFTLLMVVKELTNISHWPLYNTLI